MTDAVTVALIAAVPGSVAALGAFIVIVQNMRNHDATAGKITELSVRVDGALEKLIAAAKDSGRVAEAHDQHQRDVGISQQHEKP
jgi:hypothetical protein